MKLEANNFLSDLIFYERIGQSLNNLAESCIRPIDYSVERCFQVFGAGSSSTLQKIYTICLHALAFPGTFALYGIGEVIDNIGDLLQTRPYHYLEGQAKEKDLQGKKHFLFFRPIFACSLMGYGH